MHKRMGHANVTSILEGLKTVTVTDYEVTATCQEQMGVKQLLMQRLH